MVAIIADYNRILLQTEVEVENCNRVMREQLSQPTEPGLLQISPKSRVTFKDAGKEGFGTTRRHKGNTRVMCDIQYNAIKFKAQMVFAYLRMRTRPPIEARLTEIETNGGNKSKVTRFYGKTV